MTLSSPTASQPAFYITGGTLPPDAASYVQRQADHDLLAGLLSGEYCYILNSRQMGKSSLCVRTIGCLQQQGWRTCFLDLTKFGGKNLTAEQWYAGLLAEAGRGLAQRSEFVAYWRQHSDLGPMQRFFGALRELALSCSPEPIAVFVDEIDVTRSLPFSTDEFFAGIRQCYLERAVHPDLNRLIFCLLGTATPADLIQDTRTSPFNIGKRIEVMDFTSIEAAPLVSGLHIGQQRGNEERVLQRVLSWTGGHPYLTQRLCRTAAEAQVTSEREIDRLCAELFLSHTAKESDDNLAFVRNRLLKSEADLAAMLDLYRQMRSGKRVADDETNPLCSILKMSGVCKVEGGVLKVRNRIYAHVFDIAWVKQHLPDAELRRQKAAYRQGFILSGMLSTGFIVLPNLAAQYLAYSRPQVAIVFVSIYYALLWLVVSALVVPEDQGGWRLALRSIVITAAMAMLTLYSASDEWSLHELMTHTLKRYLMDGLFPTLILSLPVFFFSVSLRSRRRPTTLLYVGIISGLVSGAIEQMFPVLLLPGYLQSSAANAPLEIMDMVGYPLCCAVNTAVSFFLMEQAIRSRPIRYLLFAGALLFASFEKLLYNADLADVLWIQVPVVMIQIFLLIIFFRRGD